MLTESTAQAIQNIASVLIGAISSAFITWLNKRRTKSQVTTDGAEFFNKIATDNVQSAQILIDMWQEMLDEKEIHFSAEIERAKESCTAQIDLLRDDNNRLVEDLRAKIIELTSEKEQMSREIVSLTWDKTQQMEQVQKLTLKLAKYQNDLDKARARQDTQIKDKNVDFE